MIQFPTFDEAVALHEELIRRFGGTPGIRDEGLLDSALYRPQSGYYEDVVEMAAALMESLLINHPFVDGNKRMVFFLPDIFLRMNGWKITAQPQVGYRFILKLIAVPTSRFAMATQWVRRHITHLHPTSS